MDENIRRKVKISSLSFALLIICYLVFALIFQVILGIIFSKDSFVYLALNLIISPICILAVLVSFSVKEKKNLIFLSEEKKFNPVYIIFALFLGVGMFLGLGFLNSAFSEFLNSIGLKTSLVTIKANSIYEYLILILVICFLPAFFEEKFFRSFLRYYQSDLGIIAYSLIGGLLFSLYHLSASQLIYQFIFGVGLSFVSFRAKSFIPTFIVHFLNNFAIITLNFLDVAVNLNSLIVIGIGLFFLILFLFCMFIYKKHEYKDYKGTKGTQFDFWIPFGIFGTVVSALMIVVGLVG